MDTITTTYKLFGCNSACVFRGADIVEYQPHKHSRTGEPYISEKITPQCGKSKEHGAMRSEIYRRAFDAAYSARENGRTVRTVEKRFNKIAAEWRHHSCPFFSSPSDIR